MRLSSILLALMGAGSAVAHHVVSNIWIDGVNQGPGTCMRLPLNTSPVKDVNSAEMACNVNGGKQVGITCAANGTAPTPSLRE
jgi:cellulase